MNNTKKASDLIKNVFKCKKADVHFLTGGTITNKILIAHCLKPFEAVISADNGHIMFMKLAQLRQQVIRF